MKESDGGEGRFSTGPVSQLLGPFHSTPGVSGLMDPLPSAQSWPHRTRYLGAFVHVLFGSARRSKLVASCGSFACTLLAPAAPRSQRPPSLPARATLPKKSLRRQLPALFAEDGEGRDVVECARLIFISASPSPHPSRPAEGAMPYHTHREIYLDSLAEHLSSLCCFVLVRY